MAIQRFLSKAALVEIVTTKIAHKFSVNISIYYSGIHTNIPLGSSFVWCGGILRLHLVFRNKLIQTLKKTSVDHRFGNWVGWSLNSLDHRFSWEHQVLVELFGYLGMM
jgi:hypothetical protein